MKIIIKLFLFVITCLLMNLSACEPIDNNYQYKTSAFSESDQQFSIVSFYLQMPKYIEEAKKDRKQIDRIYKKFVYDPINDFASKGECSFLMNMLKNPIIDLEGLHTEIDILSESGVENIIKDALIKVSKVLPGPNTTIYLQVNDPTHKKYFPENMQTGIVAHTFGAGRIFIAIDPTTANWRNHLLKIVAHEYHHSVWISRNFKTVNFSLLEYLTLEGRADSFADLLYPAIDSPWTDLFGFEKEKSLWHRRVKNFLHLRNDQLNMKMAVGDKDIPIAAVYTMGYRIMQEFLKNNPDVPLMEWTDMEADEILMKSKYDKKFN